MGDDLTVEILKQIRDGIGTLKTELHADIAELNTGLGARIDALNTDLRTEIADLRRTVLRVARVNDETLTVSLEDSGRVEALEARVRTLETQVQELHDRR